MPNEKLPPLFAEGGIRIKHKEAPADGDISMKCEDAPIR